MRENCVSLFEVLISLKFLQEARISPDLTRVAYAVSRIESDRESFVIHVLDIASGRSEQITPEGERCQHPQWSPDGRSLSFLSDREGSHQIYLMDVAGPCPAAGGQPRRLTSIPQGVGDSHAWSPDGTQIAFTAQPPGLRSTPLDPYRVTSAVYRFDGVGYVEDARQDIYTVSARGGATTRLTSGEYCIAGLQWSPDGTEILFAAGLTPETHQLSYFTRPRLRVADICGKVRELMGSSEEVLSAAWIPRGNRIVFIARRYERSIGSKNDLWVVERNGAGMECRSAGAASGFGDSLQTDMPLALLSDRRILVGADGRDAFLQGLTQGKMEIHRAAMEGPERLKRIVTGERSCFPLDLKSHLLLFAASTFNEPMDLWLHDLKSGCERRLTDLNGRTRDRGRPPRVRHIRYTASDKVEVEGWVLLPDLRRSLPPGILFVHGGPHVALGHIFSVDCQHLAGSGYAVILINQRGSRGYGDEFATNIIGRWGELDYSDLSIGMDHLVDLKVVDPKRMGCYGLSAGGYMVCWIVGQTDRFKAAVAENPITNFTSFYGVSDIGTCYASQELGGHPFEIPLIYAKCSPITYAHRCTTPTLLMQAEMDYRCPAEQAEQFFTVLKEAGCTVEMVRFPLSSHNGSIIGAPSVRRAQNEALLEWMDRYL